MKKQITPETTAQIIELYKSGLGSDTIGKQFNIHPNTVLKELKKNGVERRKLVRQKISVEDEIKIVAMYLDDKMSMPKIAKQFGVSDALILRYLKKNGVESRSAEEAHRKYPINEDFFDVIDTQEKAYFLGILYADGCNQIDANYVRIDLARKDRDILEKLVALIYLENPLDRIFDTTRVRENGTFYYSYFDMCSKHICQTLFNLGCKNKKSLILEFPKCLIDSELQRHFIRGYYDGDGGVYLTNVKTRSATSKTISTYNFCVEMSQIIKTQTDIKFGEPYNDVEDKDVYSIRLAGNPQIERFLSWLYKDATIWMDRKYALYLKLIEKNKEIQRLIIAGTQGYQKRYLQSEKKDQCDENQTKENDENNNTTDNELHP